MQNIFVSSEVGTLRCLLVHSPDAGLGKVVPSKAQDWLFEDIVHLETMRKHEYDFYLKTLIYFLDPEKIKGKLHQIDSDENRSFFKPENPAFHGSTKVLELQKLLEEILYDELTRTKLIASICAIEHEWFSTQNELAQLPPHELAKTLIAGSLPSGEMLFAPLPNLIFTRDIGITINGHLLLNRPAKQARTREALLAQYIFFKHSIFASIRQNIIEIPDNDLFFLLPEDEKEYSRTTLEGGDVMMVAPNHLLVGISERTSINAAQAVVKILLDRKIVEKVTLVQIPKKRDYMHIDTVFTQVRRDMWVLLGSLARKRQPTYPNVEMFLEAPRLSDRMKIVQYRHNTEPIEIKHLEDLLTEISVQDLGCKPENIRFIYSGNNEFPYGDREQWTDSCNLLAIKEGVVIGYDRNDKTLEAFREAGFQTIKTADLLHAFENGKMSPETITNTFIMLPSAELSRARGGSHCMSMPLLRDQL